MKRNLQAIWFAGGCFWGLQKFFNLIHGVTDTEVGYINGKTPNPTYEDKGTETKCEFLNESGVGVVG